MNKNGLIIIIEDDEDDQIMFDLVLKRLNYENEIIYFDNGDEAFNYLVISDIEPFLILSDINMPILNGLELREKIYTDEKLRTKCIPHLLFSTSAEPEHVVEAYSKSIQGFFVKPTGIKQLEETIRKIVEYWQECVSPPYRR